MDVGREGIDALDKFLALGAGFGEVAEVGFALSSSVELSIDCIAASSAVDSPAAGAASYCTAKGPCRILTRPRIHRSCGRASTNCTCRQSLRLITCVRVWYR